MIIATLLIWVMNNTSTDTFAFVCSLWGFPKGDILFKAKQIFFLYSVFSSLCFGYVFTTKMGFTSRLSGRDGIWASYIFLKGNASGACYFGIPQVEGITFNDMFYNICSPFAQVKSIIHNILGWYRFYGVKIFLPKFLH